MDGHVAVNGGREGHTRHRHRHDSDEDDPMGMKEKSAFSARDCVAFWLLGLCNNYPYVIMLSAAAHILEGQSHAGMYVCVCEEGCARVRL